MQELPEPPPIIATFYPSTRPNTKWDIAVKKFSGPNSGMRVPVTRKDGKVKTVLLGDFLYETHDSYVFGCDLSADHPHDTYGDEDAWASVYTLFHD